MNYTELAHEINKKNSFLCIGLDSDIEKIPDFLLKNEDAVFEFNKQIIDATHNFTVAYKLNTAFYESRGIDGWKSLQNTIEYLNHHYPNIFVIADAKRGDIGNTSEQYAKAFFNNLDVDAITISPYMGIDSVSPFLSFQDKWGILLALTSNKGSDDFQFNYIPDSHEHMYEQVIRKSKKWGSKENIMYVIGATRAEYLKRIRKIIPEHFILVPGIGAQGGSLAEVAKYGINKNCGILVNSSRGVIFAGQGENYLIEVTQKAGEIQKEMSLLLKEFKN